MVVQSHVGTKSPTPATGQRKSIEECPATQALRNNTRGGLTYVTCEIREGMAILHGRTPSFYLKQLAQEIVKKVDGVELVVNRVTVGDP